MNALGKFNDIFAQNIALIILILPKSDCISLSEQLC